MNYWKWNAALGDFFFRQSRPEQRILLYLDRKLIERIGEENGLGKWEDFCAAVAEGPISIPFPHYLPDLVRNWKESTDLEPPHFLNGIAVLILAWTERPLQEMGYYEALEHFCSHSLAATSNGKELVKLLVGTFAEIRHWSEAEKGVPGTFADEAIQRYRYVGRIRHHALVEPLERDNLHYLWGKLKLNPGTEPSMDWLVHLVKNAANASSLIPKIVQLLNHKTDLARKGIREWLTEEFRNWKGAAPQAPHLASKPTKEHFELVYSLDRRKGWGLRLRHPGHKGKVEVEWNRIRLQGEIGARGWSERLTWKGEDFQCEFPLDKHVKKARLHHPQEEEIEITSTPYFFPADALGAFGADFIGLDRPLKERPFYHLFPEYEQEDWEKWAAEHKVCNWREKTLPVQPPAPWLAYFCDKIPKKAASKAVEDHPPAPESPPPPKPIFPLRAIGLEEDGWSFDPTGKRGPQTAVQISHFQVKGDGLTCGEYSEWTIRQAGRAVAPPAGFDFLTPLLEHGRSTVSFQKYYDCLERRALELDESLEKSDARLRRKESASLGYFLEDPVKRKLQLSPPALVLLPDNHFQIRASLTGIWTGALVQEVVDWCADPQNGMALDWLEQESPFLPPTGRLSFFQMELLHKLHEALNQKYPGTVGLCAAYPYPQALLETAQMPAFKGWFLEQDGMNKRDYPAVNFALCPKTYRFVPASPVPLFPLLARTYHEWYGYPMYTWWENDEKGFECNGEWAIWRLLHSLKRPVLFCDEKRSDRIFLPANLPLPTLVERALTMASGKIHSKLDHPLPDGNTISLRCFEEIPFPMRNRLPKLLLGIAPGTPSKSFFHPLSFTPQHLLQWTN